MAKAEGNKASAAAAPSAYEGTASAAAAPSAYEGTANSPLPGSPLTELSICGAVDMVT